MVLTCWKLLLWQLRAVGTACEAFLPLARPITTVEHAPTACSHWPHWWSLCSRYLWRWHLFWGAFGKCFVFDIVSSLASYVLMRLTGSWLVTGGCDTITVASLLFWCLKFWQWWLGAATASSRGLQWCGRSLSWVPSTGAIVVPELSDRNSFNSNFWCGVRTIFSSSNSICSDVRTIFSSSNNLYTGTSVLLFLVSATQYTVMPFHF